VSNINRMGQGVGVWLGALLLYGNCRPKYLFGLSVAGSPSRLPQ